MHTKYPFTNHKKDILSKELNKVIVNKYLSCLHFSGFLRRHKSFLLPTRWVLNPEDQRINRLFFAHTLLRTLMEVENLIQEDKNVPDTNSFPLSSFFLLFLLPSQQRVPKGAGSLCRPGSAKQKKIEMIHQSADILNLKWSLELRRLSPNPENKNICTPNRCVSLSALRRGFRKKNNSF